MASTRTYRSVTCQESKEWKLKKQSNLDWVLVGKEVDDLERMCNNADGEKLLAVITTLHHQTGSAHIQYGRRCENIIANLSTRRSTMGI